MTIALVLLQYVTLLYCTGVTIIQAGRVRALRHTRVYDKQKRHRLIVMARRQLVMLIVCTITLAVTIMATVVLGSVLSW